MSCAACGEPCGPDGGGTYLTLGDELYHSKCYDKRCHKCGEKLESAFVTLAGHSWHAACVRCATCDAALSGSIKHVDGTPYCDEHAQEARMKEALSGGDRGGSAFADEQCAKCSEPLGGSKLKALDGVWHVKCFSCTTCDKVLATEAQGKFKIVDGKPYCHPCAEKVKAIL
mmetsp:Transcript_41829/g.102932  ORF Transcript_41829/g.102932 Transcript_41829/m.102932 type:complete len:171 (-) Transcript_41829:140-652(-)